MHILEYAVATAEVQRVYDLFANRNRSVSMILAWRRTKRRSLENRSAGKHFKSLQRSFAEGWSLGLSMALDSPKLT